MGHPFEGCGNNTGVNNLCGSLNSPAGKNHSFETPVGNVKYFPGDSGCRWQAIAQGFPYCKIQPGTAEWTGKDTVSFQEGNRRATLGALMFDLPHDEFGFRNADFGF
jgi:hypothetical protein